MTELFTIGFTKKTAEEFFGILNRHGIKQLLDVRLYNSSQLAGYSKKDDLRFFLRTLCGATYSHEHLLAPTNPILLDYKLRKLTWPKYERAFLRLLTQRHVESRIERSLFEVPTVLLCSEDKPERCHRRLVAEYLQTRWQDVRPVHL